MEKVSFCVRIPEKESLTKLALHLSNESGKLIGIPELVRILIDFGCHNRSEISKHIKGHKND